MFFLTADLRPSGLVRQLRLLTGELAKGPARPQVGVLGPADADTAAEFRAAGVAVHTLPVRHMIDVRGARALRRAVAAANPAVVHAWGPAAARACPLVVQSGADGGNTPRVVVSGASVAGGGLTGWLTTRATRRADRVVPVTWAEAERYRRLGVPAGHLTRIGPAVAPASAPDRGAVLRELGLPPGARLIVTAGRLEANAGLKAAIWAFDMLRYDFPDLHLLVFGDGPDRAELEAFGRAIAFDDFRVRFPGMNPGLPGILGLAEAVWVTRHRGGVHLALEAMATGRTVIGWKTAELAEVVEDGVTGFLVPPGERPPVAARTYPLLQDPGLGDAIGRAGRVRAAERYAVGRMADQYVRLYAEVVR